MRQIIATGCLAFLLSGCSMASLPGFAQENDTPKGLIGASYGAIDRLLAAIPSEKALDPGKPVIVATLVNVDDLHGSRLGRIIAEQASARLTQKGFAVVELKLRDRIFIKQGGGEFLLSREVQDITLNHQAQAVLVGTYAQALSTLYLNLKLVAAGDGQVIAAHDFAIPLDGDTRSLLWARNGP